MYNQSYHRLINSLNPIQLQEYIVENNKSLINFFSIYLKIINPPSALVILELGCGLGGLTQYLAELGHHVTGVDQSESAIEYADKHNQFKTVKYICQDIAEVSFDASGFDLIIDSHLLHCLVEDNQRLKLYQNILNWLKPTGHFMGEVMSLSNNLSHPDGYSLDSTGLLYENNKPIRKIFNHLSFEAELIQHHFIIKYFYYRSDLSINPYFSSGLPIQFLPKVIRFIAAAQITD
jgi:SAM-dependent methyltransferase